MYRPKPVTRNGNESQLFSYLNIITSMRIQKSKKYGEYEEYGVSFHNPQGTH